MEFIENKIPRIEKKEMCKLTASETASILESYPEFNSCYLCNINDTFYHWKELYDDTSINELLGKIISEYFKDEKVESKIIQDENRIFYLLSENFIKTGKHYSIFYQGLFPQIEFDENKQLELYNLDLLDKINSDRKILNTDKQDLNKLKYRLKAMIINDFIRHQSDRWYQNFLIQYDGNHCQLMPLYDFEYSFLEHDENLENSFKFDLNDKSVIKYVKKDEDFQELLDLAMNLDMKIVFERLFDEYPVMMNKDEINQYHYIVRNKKEEIKRYKLIK